MIERTIEVTLSPEEVAEAFCSMSSIGQAAVLCAVNKYARQHWTTYNTQRQWTELGLALAEMGENAEPAKSFLCDVSSALQHFTDHPVPKVRWVAAVDSRTYDGGP